MLNFIFFGLLRGCSAGYSPASSPFIRSRKTCTLLMLIKAHGKSPFFHLLSRPRLFQRHKTLLLRGGRGWPCRGSVARRPARVLLLPHPGTSTLPSPGVFIRNRWLKMEGNIRWKAELC